MDYFDVDQAMRDLGFQNNSHPSKPPINPSPLKSTQDGRVKNRNIKKQEIREMQRKKIDQSLQMGAQGFLETDYNPTDIDGETQSIITNNKIELDLFPDLFSEMGTRSEIGRTKRTFSNARHSPSPIARKSEVCKYIPDDITEGITIESILDPNSAPLLKSNETFSVTFKLRHQVNLGESICVAGEIEELGKWEKLNCQMQWTEGNIWVLNDLIVNSKPFFNYKYVIVQDNKAQRWERGHNRIADLRLLTETINPIVPYNSKIMGNQLNQKIAGQKRVELLDQWETLNLRFMLFFPVSDPQNEALVLRANLPQLNGREVELKMSQMRGNERQDQVISKYGRNILIYQADIQDNPDSQFFASLPVKVEYTYFKRNHQGQKQQERVKRRHFEIQKPETYQGFRQNGAKSWIVNGFVSQFDGNFVAPGMKVQNFCNTGVLIGSCPESEKDIMSLAQLGVSQVINLMTLEEQKVLGTNLQEIQKMYSQKSITYENAPLRDSVMEDYCKDLFYLAKQISQTVDLKRKTVFIHCLSGVSRAPTLAAVYAILFKRIASWENIQESVSLFGQNLTQVYFNQQVIEQVVIDNSAFQSLQKERIASSIIGQQRKTEIIQRQQSEKPETIQMSNVRIKDDESSAIPTPVIKPPVPLVRSNSMNVRETMNDYETASLVDELMSTARIKGQETQVDVKNSIQSRRSSVRKIGQSARSNSRMNLSAKSAPWDDQKSDTSDQKKAVELTNDKPCTQDALKIQNYQILEDIRRREEEMKREEMRKEEMRKEEMRKEEMRKEEMRKEEIRREEMRREQLRREEQRREEVRKEEQRKKEQERKLEEMKKMQKIIQEEERKKEELKRVEQERWSKEKDWSRMNEEIKKWKEEVERVNSEKQKIESAVEVFRRRQVEFDNTKLRMEYEYKQRHNQMQTQIEEAERQTQVLKQDLSLKDDQITRLIEVYKQQEKDTITKLTQENNTQLTLLKEQMDSRFKTQIKEYTRLLLEKDLEINKVIESQRKDQLDKKIIEEEIKRIRVDLDQEGIKRRELEEKLDIKERELELLREEIVQNIPNQIFQRVYLEQVNDTIEIDNNHSLDDTFISKADAIIDLHPIPQITPPLLSPDPLLLAQIEKLEADLKEANLVTSEKQNNLVMAQEEINKKNVMIKELNERIDKERRDREETDIKRVEEREKGERRLREIIEESDRKLKEIGEEWRIRGIEEMEQMNKKIKDVEEEGERKRRESQEEGERRVQEVVFKIQTEQQVILEQIKVQLETERQKKEQSQKEEVKLRDRIVRLEEEVERRQKQLEQERGEKEEERSKRQRREAEQETEIRLLREERERQSIANQQVIIQSAQQKADLMLEIQREKMEMAERRLKEEQDISRREKEMEERKRRMDQERDKMVIEQDIMNRELVQLREEMKRIKDEEKVRKEIQVENMETAIKRVWGEMVVEQVERQIVEVLGEVRSEMERQTILDQEKEQVHIDTIRSEQKTLINTFTPNKSNTLDLLIHKHLQNLKIQLPVHQVKSGVYLIGPARINCQQKFGQVLVKVGGGHQKFEEFLLKNHESLKNQLNQMVLKSGQDVDKVFNLLKQGKKVPISNQPFVFNLPTLSPDIETKSIQRANSSNLLDSQPLTDINEFFINQNLSPLRETCPFQIYQADDLRISVTRPSSNLRDINSKADSMDKPRMKLNEGSESRHSEGFKSLVNSEINQNGFIKVKLQPKRN